MKELWFWRVATAIACIGWGVTWWTADSAPGPKSHALSAEGPQSGQGQEEGARMGRGKGLQKGLGMGPRGGRGGAGSAGFGPQEGSADRAEDAPPVQVSEESLELARQELAQEREERFLARMEERHAGSMESLDAFAEENELSEEEVTGVEEAIDLRFEAMGEAFAGEGMEPDARREHMRAVADAFEMQVVGVLGEELGAAYLEQVQRPSWGRIGQDPER